MDFDTPGSYQNIDNESSPLEFKKTVEKIREGAL